MPEAEREAWLPLREAVVSCCGASVGTAAGCAEVLKYDQVFVRDRFSWSWEETVDCDSPGQAVMPASFRVRTVPLDGNDEQFEEALNPGFGESAIGGAAPVDSGIFLVQPYRGLCISRESRCADWRQTGSCMIDRRMGIHGHPLEIQTCHTDKSTSISDALQG